MNLSSDFKGKLPNQPGVYFFLSQKTPIYIGRATNLKSRIISHFQSAKIDPKENLIISQSDDIKFIPTQSDFEAVLLEADLIKKHQPKYNFRWKDDKNFLYIKITNDEFPKVLVVRKENDKKSTYFGPFGNKSIVNEFLRDIRKLIPFCSQKKLSKKPCFYSKINLCQPCPNYINSLRNKDKKLFRKLKREYLNNINKIVDLLNRNFKKILNYWEKKLKKAIKEEKYEEGITLRNKIYILNQLINRKFNESIELTTDNDHIKREINFFFKNYFNIDNYQLKRIECYDISNYFGQHATGSMVVFENNIPNKSQYRRFRIKKIKKISDVEMMKEIIIRRFKNYHWPKPNLIVVDGGKSQLSSVIQTLFQLKINIPVLSIAKNPDRVMLYNGSRFLTINFSQNSGFFNLLKRIRDESHRFAKKYHIFLRKNFIYN